MTQESNSRTVAPPEDEPESPVKQAQLFHDTIDRMKEWSFQMAQELREERAGLEASGEATDDELNTLTEMAALVGSVETRIEMGDRNRARQP